MRKVEKTDVGRTDPVDGALVFEIIQDPEDPFTYPLEFATDLEDDLVAILDYLGIGFVEGDAVVSMVRDQDNENSLWVVIQDREVLD